MFDEQTKSAISDYSELFDHYDIDKKEKIVAGNEPNYQVLNQLKNKDHPYLKWILNNRHYQSALRVFEQHFYYQLVESSIRAKLLNVEYVLHGIIAKALYSYIIAENFGSDVFIRNKAKETKITNEIKQLMTSIEGYPPAKVMLSELLDKLKYFKVEDIILSDEDSTLALSH